MPRCHRIGLRTVVSSTWSRTTGATFGRDPPGEALSDRHPHALPHLVLDAVSGARDEVHAGRVEQQHGRGVHLEELDGTLEQLGKELIEVKVDRARASPSSTPRRRVSSATRHPPG